jgi:predicted phage terminase large subunit-like protein
LKALFNPNSILQRQKTSVQSTQSEGQSSTLTFTKWLKEVSPNFSWDWRHLVFIRGKLEQLKRGEIAGKKHLMINCPPRHGKSEQGTVRWPVYLLEQDPTQRVGIAAYNQRLANKFSRKARKIAQTRIEISYERKAVEEWETAQGGSLRAVGIGGGITGDGVHWLIIDDPVRGRADVISDAIRESTWEWFTDDLYTRLEPGGHIVLTMTRWHEDDMAGRILASDFADEWEVINLPALAEENDPLDRKYGEALCPERYDEKALAAIKRVLDEEFDSLYQGNPTRAEGNIFKRVWMNKRYNPQFLPTFYNKVQTIDSSFKTGVGNDYSVIATWATDDIDYYLLDIWREKVEMPDLLTAIKDQYGKWHPNAVLIEDAASGQSATQTIRRTTRIPVIPYSVNEKGSKVARAEGIAPLFRVDKVQLPDGQGCEWIDDWIKEHCGFPTAAHDDQVDTTSMALDHLSGGNIFGIVNPEIAQELASLDGNGW